MKKRFCLFYVVAVFISVLIPIKASAYQIENDPIQFSYFPGYSTNEVLILHESGNPSNVEIDSLDREVSYMKRNWTSAYVSFFVGSGGRVVQLAPVGYYQYGAGSIGNSKAYAQIELARTNNKEVFKKDYAAYVNLTRDLAKQAGFTYDLDDSTNYGIKTHLWVTQNWWGDHTDPYEYLASWGISKAQLQNDLYTGLQENGGNVIVTPKPTPTPEKTTYTTDLWNINQSVDVNGLRVRKAQNTSSDVIRELNKGQLFNATRITKNGESVTVGNTTYKTWFEVDGVGWVSGAYVTPSEEVSGSNPASNSRIIKNGTFTTDRRLPVSVDTDPNSLEVAAYSSGQSIQYDSYVVENGYVWISYIGSSGNRRYIAIGPNDGNVANTWGSGF